MSGPSASSLPRISRCLASVVYPQHDFSTKDAVAGVERHKLDEEAIDVGDTSTLPDKVAALVAGMTVQSEVAFALDAFARKARILGVKLGRNYGPTDALELPGTCDLLAVSADQRVVIGDRKGFEEVDHPSSNKQTLFYAAAAALVFGVSEVTVAIYGAFGEPRIATLEMPELDEFIDWLRDLNPRVEVARSDPRSHERPGNHCTYCNAFESCSQSRALVAAVESAEVVRRIDGLATLDDDDFASWSIDFADRVRQLLKRLDARIEARARQRPIPRPDGRVYGLRVKPGGAKLDADKTVLAIREILGINADKFEAVAIERSTSKAAIKRAAQKFAPKGGIGALEEQIVARVEKLGGVTRKPTESLEEFVPLLNAANT